MFNQKIVSTLTLTFLFLAASSFSATAQTTSFTYQGKLTTSGSPAVPPAEVTILSFVCLIF